MNDAIDEICGVPVEKFEQPLSGIVDPEAPPAETGLRWPIILLPRSSLGILMVPSAVKLADAGSAGMPIFLGSRRNSR